MLVSHEVPISLLNQSKNFNDYDYCLLHLTYKYPEYKNYYINSVKQGRKVLLDNSLFELGDSLTNDQLAQGVKDINPTWYIIPDCLNDCDETIRRFEDFIERYSDLPGIKIGVVQGDSIKSFIKCYQFMSKHADKIAIPFDSKAFDELYKSDDQLTVWCNGRPLMIKLLKKLNIWNYDKPHHLLGCSYAKEFANIVYNNLNIESIDTSNPIVGAIKKLRYNKDGLNCKPKIKLCDLIETKLSKDQLKLIYRNTYIFKNILYNNSRKKWIVFFSQTGSEIINICESINKSPDLIVTNRSSLQGINQELIDKYINKFYFLPCKPSIEDYTKLITLKSDIFRNCVITLHGYLRIVPDFMCNKFEIYNGHPGDVTIQDGILKGKDPQLKAFNLGLQESGSTIHKCTPELDGGEIIDIQQVSIKGLTLDQVYETLHKNSSSQWSRVLNKLLKENKK